MPGGKTDMNSAFPFSAVEKNLSAGCESLQSPVKSVIRRVFISEAFKSRQYKFPNSIKIARSLSSQNSLSSNSPFVRFDLPTVSRGTAIGNILNSPLTSYSSYSSGRGTEIED